jgi:hypothetical protein
MFVRASSHTYNKLVRRSTSTIIDKKDHMRKIRETTHGLFGGGGRGYYICLTHTYPAWKKITSVRSFKEFKDSVQKNSFSAQNPYGHASVDFFRFSQGNLIQDCVINVGINGPNGNDIKKFIYTIPSELYYLNNSEENEKEHVYGNQQGGLLQRSFISTIIKSSESEYNELYQFYEQLQKRMINEKNMEFKIASGILLGKFRSLFPSMNEKGNCCYWSSQGLVKIGFLSSISHYPLACFYKLLLNLHFKKRDRFKNCSEYKIVLYKGIDHNNIPRGSLIYPFYWIKHQYSKIWNLENLADFIVQPVPDNNGNYTLKIIPVDEKEKDISWINECLNTLNRIFRE